MPCLPDHSLIEKYEWNVFCFDVEDSLVRRPCSIPALSPWSLFHDDIVWGFAGHLLILINPTVDWPADEHNMFIVYPSNTPFANIITLCKYRSLRNNLLSKVFMMWHFRLTAKWEKFYSLTIVNSCHLMVCDINVKNLIPWEYEEDDVSLSKDRLKFFWNFSLTKYT